jgi:hypothetical protein
MKRVLGLTSAWVLLASTLYLPLLLLDVYWNIVTWRPTWDWCAALLIVCIAATSVGFYSLCRMSRDRTTRAISLPICLGLIGMGLYAYPAEPASAGMFGRVASSPWWYRAGRLLLMGVPALTWWATLKL